MAKHFDLLSHDSWLTLSGYPCHLEFLTGRYDPTMDSRALIAVAQVRPPPRAPRQGDFARRSTQLLQQGRNCEWLLPVHTPEVCRGILVTYVSIYSIGVHSRGSGLRNPYLTL